ncbi:hypothetical protein Pcinc_022282 [Petrolisthes cinctipes]|uniref:Methylthioribose-1-phosphate isomerase n=1 Tax=Petrolisthes cinctipes TaxID=88211 RepID=A0AAE1FDY9_PETCI|nr:hypothetical protein Pcinc_022282 [Petrolisthes cinctipes]
MDQLQLPMETNYIEITSVKEGWEAIHKMQVRGAPAIAIVGCLSLAVELSQNEYQDKEELFGTICTKLDYLVTARPTAVNMKNAVVELKEYVLKLYTDSKVSTQDMVTRTCDWCGRLLEKDIDTNKKLSDLGAKSVLAAADGVDKVCVLTHCNTGSLATAGYGTALGVVRSLHAARKLEHIYCTETRPYNQGSRLTAYEIMWEIMPGTLVCDSTVAALMAHKKVHAVLVGADRVAANGDTANKIGTYQLAVVAKHFSVPFYVCAPTTSIDFSLPAGCHIPIEERPNEEMTYVAGKRLACPGIRCWNPAFDVTPADLITGGVVTEVGVFKPSELIQKLNTNKIF